MAQFLINNNFNILFTLGGDGTLRATNKLNEELRRRNVPIAVIGIPKTVENDICYTDNTFGFNTARLRVLSIIREYSICRLFLNYKKTIILLF